MEATEVFLGVFDSRHYKSDSPGNRNAKLCTDSLARLARLVAVDRGSIESREFMVTTAA